MKKVVENILMTILSSIIVIYLQDLLIPFYFGNILQKVAMEIGLLAIYSIPVYIIVKNSNMTELSEKELYADISAVSFVFYVFSLSSMLFGSAESYLRDILSISCIIFLIISVIFYSKINNYSKMEEKEHINDSSK